MALRAEYEEAISTKMETFEKDSKISQIFRHLSDLLSFIDYKLLQFLVEEFGSKELQEEMTVYVEMMEAFFDETTIEQLMPHWPGRRKNTPDLEELKMKIDKDPSKYTLRQLDELRKKFCTEVRLYQTVLVLIGVGKCNSFLITWAVPSIFVPRLKSVISTLTSFYQGEHILSVTLGSQRLHSIAVSDFVGYPGAMIVSLVSYSCCCLGCPMLEYIVLFLPP